MRFETTIYVCRCRIEYPANEHGPAYVDRCPSVVSGPDEPMCDACLAHDHDKHPRQIGLRRVP